MSRTHVTSRGIGRGIAVALVTLIGQVVVNYVGNRTSAAEGIARAIAVIARVNRPFSTEEILNVDGGFHLRTL